MSEKIIKIGDATAFILKNKSEECKEGKTHLFKDTVMYSASGKRIDWKTYKQWAHLTSEVRRELIWKHHQDIVDPITSESSSCIHCGIAYVEYDNPHYH